MVEGVHLPGADSRPDVECRSRALGSTGRQFHAKWGQRAERRLVTPTPQPNLSGYQINRRMLLPQHTKTTGGEI